MKTKTLRCGCCGDGFKTWEGYVNQDQDLDYGICYICQADENGRLEGLYEKLMTLFEATLSTDRLEEFKKLEEVKQVYIIHQAFNDGVITFKIGE